MDLQVLISTMNQTDYSLLEQMNISSDAIIVNQCDSFSYDSFIINQHKIQWYSFNERGIGLSRNTALMRATSDIVLFADDDEILESNYKEIIVNSFLMNPNTDVLFFQIDVRGKNRQIKKENNHIIHRFNSLKYGTVQIAARTQSLRQANISFSLLFGGGAKYSSGEDTLFIQECLKKGLKIKFIDKRIAILDSNRSSTWFKGFTQKYFFDKGILLRQCFGRFSFIICCLFIIKHIETTKDIGFFDAFTNMLKGTLKKKI